MRSGRTIDSLYVARGQKTGSLTALIAKAKQKDITIKEADVKKLDFMCGNANHQGVVAVAAIKEYADLEDIFQLAQSRGEAPFIILADELEDPHNLGSIARTAELFGAHGIIIPKRRSVSVNSTVYKSSVGAIEHMKIAKVTNINNTIDELKENGIWVYGTDIRAKEYSYEADFAGPCAIIIGNEGKGMSKLTIQKCDKLIKIPMVGKINSLNASVAGGIMMYEILKGRLK